MNNYEIAAVFKIMNDDASKNAAIDKVKGFITANKGTVTEVKEVGKRELAYEIKKNKEGYYCYMQFNAEPQAIRNLDNACKIDEELLRYIIIKK